MATSPLQPRAWLAPPPLAADLLLSHFFLSLPHNLKSPFSMRRTQVMLHQRLRFMALTCTRVTLRSPARPSLMLPRAVQSMRHASIVPPSSSSSQVPSPSAPELRDSLDRIVPDAMFANLAREVGARKKAALPRDVARSVVGTVLCQLRDASDTKTIEEARRAEEEADAAVNRELVKASLSLADLHAFATLLIRSSTDPRRQPIAFRLFAIAHGVDPMSTPDPTSASPSTASPTQGEADERPTLAAPGYSWASMVLQGAAPPPLGFHLLPPSSPARTELRTAQQAAAVRMYATLAMRGDAMGLLGMGRVLLGGINATPKEGEAERSAKEKRDVREKVTGMWRRAAEAGVGEAWFELGVLELADGPGHVRDAASAQALFERGAKANNARSHHALGVLLSQEASSPTAASSRKELLARSLSHFAAAAKLGDAQSAHNAGLRFLLREELLGQVSHELGSRAQAGEVRRVAGERHLETWGVAADDAKAREWFQRAADLGSLPASLNLAGMLVEDRGAPPSSSSSSSGESDHLAVRLADLQVAEKLYMRVMALASVSEAPEAKQMGEFAKETGESVKAMIRELVETRRDVAAASAASE